MGGAGGTGPSCAGDPSLCEGRLCNQCTFGVAPGEPDLCSETGICHNCVDDTDGCGHLSSDSARVRCWALYTCLRDQPCMKDDGDAVSCWCGVADRAMCLTGAQAGKGPCLQQFIDAAGSSDPAFINQHIIDPSIALGSAVNLANCRWNYCGAKSGLEIPACPLW
jgi:hypothetical protein